MLCRCVSTLATSYTHYCPPLPTGCLHAYLPAIPTTAHYRPQVVCIPTYQLYPPLPTTTHRLSTCLPTSYTHHCLLLPSSCLHAHLPAIPTTALRLSSCLPNSYTHYCPLLTERCLHAYLPAIPTTALRLSSCLPNSYTHHCPLQLTGCLHAYLPAISTTAHYCAQVVCMATYQLYPPLPSGGLHHYNLYPPLPSGGLHASRCGGQHFPRSRRPACLRPNAMQQRCRFVPSLCGSL